MLHSLLLPNIALAFFPWPSIDTQGLVLLSVANNCWYSCLAIAIKHYNNGAQYIIQALDLDNGEYCRYITSPAVSPHTRKKSAFVSHFTLNGLTMLLLFSRVLWQHTTMPHVLVHRQVAQCSVQCAIHDTCLSNK